MISLKWYKNRLCNLVKIAGPLSIYTDPLDIPEEIYKNAKDKERYYQLVEKYIDVYVTCQSLKMGFFKEDYVDLDGKHFEDANSLIDYLENTCKTAIKELAVF